jgi:diguanylate cyclase (GGDEF)-like protein/PAS domain S-box-containing protein
MAADFELILQLTALANTLPDPIFVIDYEGRYIDVLGGACRGVNDSAHALVGRHLREVLPEDKWTLFLGTVQKAVDTGTLQTCEYQMSAEEIRGIKANGPRSPQWYQGRVYPVAHMPGETRSAVWLVVNISKQKQLEEKLRRLEEVDELTGVYNRRYFIQRLGSEIQIARRRNQELSLITIDVDFFQTINVDHGHETGDRALRILVTTIGKHLRETDILARVGGEEFALICPATDLAAAFALAERIRGIVADLDLKAEGKPVNMTISLGVSGLSAADSTVNQMLTRADHALHRAKGEGRNRVCASPIT